jgi:drug/metabolite transporter (DMT)-like permease
MMYTGELAALSAAGLWASATFMFAAAGRQLSPIQLNISKGIIASILLGGCAVALERIPEEIWTMQGLLLGLSGILGITIGDTAFFGALSRIGPRRALLIESLTPPLTGLIALVAIQEELTLTAWCGVLVTVAGVTSVVLERSQPGELQIAPDVFRVGLILAVIASISQATGVVMAHIVLIDHALDPLWAAFIRLMAALAGLLMAGSFMPKQGTAALGRKISQGTLGRKLWVMVFWATVMGTFLGLWLQQISLKYTSAAVAQTLLSTSPLFALAIAKVRGEELSRRAILGTLVALVGIYLLT